VPLTRPLVSRSANADRSVWVSQAARLRAEFVSAEIVAFGLHDEP